MNPLSSVLAQLATQGLRLDLREDRIAVTPKDKLDPALRADVLRHRAEILELLTVHGNSLLDLFRNAPAWPLPRGRSGLLDPGWWSAVGGPVKLVDGREGRLSFLRYDTGTGRVRFRIEFPNGWALVDPEDATWIAEIKRRTA